MSVTTARAVAPSTCQMKKGDEPPKQLAALPGGKVWVSTGFSRVGDFVRFYSWTNPNRAEGLGQGFSLI